MKSYSIASLAGVACGALALCALCTAAVSAQEPASSVSAPPTKVMNQYRGIKLGLKPEEVRAALGKPESSSPERDEFKLSDDDLLTVHYENGTVKAIQLYFSNPKNAPAFAEVVGNAEVTQNESGGRFARVVVQSEKFWVSMFQNKDKTVTTITISR